jgi:hypothetical protein
MREKRKKKCADHVRKKCETKLVSGLVSENVLSNLVSNFNHQIFLVKIVRLLEVIFQCFYQIGSLK